MESARDEDDIPQEKKFRRIQVLIVLTVFQYGGITPVIQFLVLTFFAQSYGHDDCEKTPDSGPCRRAASDAAVYLGVANGVVQGFSWFSALVLGSWSDGLGRRPLLQAKALLSTLPILAIALHLFGGMSMWVYLVAMPMYQAFDVNGVFMGYVSDVITDPGERSRAYAELVLNMMSAAGPAVLIGGWSSAGFAVWLALGVCMAKIAFVMRSLPETRVQPCNAQPMGFLSMAFAVTELLKRNSFISRMAVIFCLSGLSVGGLGTVTAPYLTGYLGVDRSTGVRLALIVGSSVCISIMLGLRPLLANLGEVRALQLCLAFTAALPLAYCLCSKTWHLFVLAGAFAGPVFLQFPVIAALKSNLACEDEQGLMQGSLASLRVLAEALSGALFSLVFRHSTAGGRAAERSAAFPAFGLASSLGLLALVVASTLPQRLPLPGKLEVFEQGTHAELAVGSTQYDSLRDHGSPR